MKIVCFDMVMICTNFKVVFLGQIDSDALDFGMEAFEFDTVPRKKSRFCCESFVESFVDGCTPKLMCI